MKEIWVRLENWLELNTPTNIKFINSGTSLLEIEETEKLLEIIFPEDVRKSYLIHNGQPENAPGLIDGVEFLSLKRIKQEWTNWKDLLDEKHFEGISSEPHEEIKNDWWNPRWIPLTYDGSGNHICLDLDPTEKGKVGQIITMWHDSRERELLADDFSSWLENYVDELEEGRYIFDDEEYYAIVDKNDLS